MWALIYKLKEVVLKEVTSIDEVSNEKDVIEAHCFDREKDILIDSNYKTTNLENNSKDNNDELHFDEEMFISKLFSKLYNSRYTNKNKIVIRNYLDFNEDGILYVSSSRLLEVK